MQSHVDGTLPRVDLDTLVPLPALKTECASGEGAGLAVCPTLRQWFRFVHSGGEMSTASLFSRFGRHRSSLSLFLQVQ